eukprot:g71196.t1
MVFWPLLWLLVRAGWATDSLPATVADDTHWTARCLAGDASIGLDGCSVGEVFNQTMYHHCPPASELPRHCLLSRVRLNTTYRRLSCCFSCCAKLWFNFMGLWYREHHADLLLRRYWPAIGCMHTKRDKGLCNFGKIRGAVCNDQNSEGCNFRWFIHRSDFRDVNHTEVLRLIDKHEQPYVMVLFFDKSIRARPLSWMLDHPKVLHVFAQNIAGNVMHPKLSIRPRELYERSPSVRTLMRQWLLAHQDRPFLRRPDPPRPLTMVCNAFDNRILIRKTALKNFSSVIREKYSCGEPSVADNKDYNWTVYADRISRADYLMSPRGWGAETPKPIEATYLGAIPIVAYQNERWTNHMDLWLNSPTLVLEDWGQLTEERMQEHMQMVKERYDSLDLSRFFEPYWLYQYSRFFQPNVTLLPQNLAEDFWKNDLS